MFWEILLCVAMLAGIVAGSIWLGHVITMRAFSYQNPMTGNMTTMSAGGESVGIYTGDEDFVDEEPDDVLQAHQSMEALRALGIEPEDTLGPEGPVGHVNMDEEEPHV